MFYSISSTNMLELTKQLIGFDTTKNENTAMEFIQKYVYEMYRDMLIYEHQDINDQGRYNLIIKNTNNPDIILAGHVDTVPEFSKEQFFPKVEWNKLYGRGAVDMKAGVAINISLIEYSNSLFLLNICLKHSYLNMKNLFHYFWWIGEFVY